METETTYRCRDGNSGCEIDVVATSAADAAREYVTGGNWTADETFWVRVYVTVEGADEEEVHTVAVDPEEPACSGPEHDWQSPIEIVGGCRENPGVFGHGGGVLIHEVCACCGEHRHTDTWAQDSETGEQGLTSIRYGDEWDGERGGWARA